MKLGKDFVAVRHLSVELQGARQAVAANPQLFERAAQH
jgi:hypothetical protein